MTTLLYLLGWLAVVAALWVAPGLLLAFAFDRRLLPERLLGVWIPLAMPLGAFAWIGLRLAGMPPAVALAAVAAVALGAVPLVLRRARPASRERTSVEAEPGGWVGAMVVVAVALALVVAALWGVEVRRGSDVVFQGRPAERYSYTDRAFYASIVGRAAAHARPDNPVVAGEPLATPYPAGSPAAALDAVFGVPALEAWTRFLMPSSLALTVVACWVMARAFGLGRRRSLVAVALVVLGSDLGVLVRLFGVGHPAWLAMMMGATSYFLMYNPWTLVLPTAFAALTLLAQRPSRPGALAVAAVAIGLLAVSKPFVLPCLFVAALLLPRRRGLVFAMLAPVVALALLRAYGAGGGLGIDFAPGAFIRHAGERLTWLSPLFRDLIDSPWAYFAAGLLVSLPLTFGVRLAGLARAGIDAFRRRPPARRTGGLSRRASRLVTGVALGGLLPVAVVMFPANPFDVYQFLFLPLWLAWVPVAAMLPRPRRDALTIGGVAIALLALLQAAPGFASYHVRPINVVPARVVDGALDFRARTHPDAVIVTYPDIQQPLPFAFLSERRTLISASRVMEKVVPQAEIFRRRDVASKGVAVLRGERWPGDWPEVWYIRRRDATATVLYPPPADAASIEGD